jgi:hypothetical protein
MSVEQPKVIDVISTDSKSGYVLLTVSDHLDWNDLDSHMMKLQEKLNYYLAFVESGEILESYPSAKGRSILIEVIFKHPPISEATEFLQKTKTVIEGAGFGFRWEHLSIV